MEINFETLLQRLTEFIQKEAKTETVIGEPFKLGEFTCVPVVRVGVGFGSGGGEGDSAKTGKGHGGGVGAGIGIDPIGFLVTKGNEISFISTQQSKGLSNMFQQVPDLIMKFMEKKETMKA
ncbi:MAG: spore germination protein GerW family protein [Chryseosolibacter sp.]